MGLLFDLIKLIKGLKLKGGNNMGKQQVTSAMANKMIKALEDDKREIILAQENNMSYIETVGYDLEIPEYNFRETQDRIAEIDEKIRKIKHAINIFNTTTILPEVKITIDEALVYMAQLNRVLMILERMKDATKKSRYRGSDRSLVEYQCVNYEIEDARHKYEVIRAQITAIQLALDKVNQTVLFEIDVD